MVRFVWSVRIGPRAVPHHSPSALVCLRPAHQDVVYLRVVVEWSVCVLIVNARCPLLAARTPAGRRPVPSALSCPICAHPRRRFLCGPHSSVTAFVASIALSLLLSSKLTSATAGNHTRMRWADLRSHPKFKPSGAAHSGTRALT